jgi:hypothetical protein
MNKDTLERLLSILPEGNRKQELVTKYNKILQSNTKKRGGDGLQDTFEFQPKGHIRIEAIDELGNVVGLLADQPNLVVDGAEEILLRSFSGDPNRALYKNRTPKAVGGVTGKIYIAESKLSGENLIEGSQLLHAPNVLWAEVNDEDFDISFGYYPVTLYIKEEVSLEVGKKAFSFSKTSAADRIPVSSEIYSTYTNLFIGIGEGKNEPVALNDNRLVRSTGVVATDTSAVATIEGESIEFKAKISNFKLDFEASDSGAQIDVFINGVLKETIETFDSGLTSSEVRSFEYGGIDYETETTVRIVHSGGDVSVTTPKMSIVGIAFDELNKGMNKLMKEFKNFETEFVTPAVYNTTPMGPFVIQLPNFPLKDGSVVISYEGVNFTKVADDIALTDTTFHVDHLRGVVTFNRALTGLMGTYSVTGELYDSEMVASMVAGTVPVTTVTPTPVISMPLTGVVNGSNKGFAVPHTNVDPSTLIVKVAGTTAVVTSFDPLTKAVLLSVAPTVGQAVTADYTYAVTTVSNRPSNNYLLGFVPSAGSIVLTGQDGVALTPVTDVASFMNGTYMLDTVNPKLVKIAQNTLAGQPVTRIEIRYKSDERPGVPTNYTRAVIEKPKTINEYPWFELDKGSVRFVAEFPELKPGHNITIREMGLFDGPRVDDKIAGFRNYPVKAFSLVRVGETRKEVNTGIRITWTITLLNSDSQPFQGGR